MTQRNPSPTGVLFDLDGTLIATRRLYLEAFADALEPTLGRRPTHDEMIALRPRAELRFLEEIGGRPGHQDVMERFYEAYLCRHDRDFEGVYEGVAEMLGRLRSAAVRIGLVTGKSRRSWAITEPRIGLGSFHVGVFDDDVPAAKPDPTGLHLAVGHLGESPERVVYVGDSATDVEAAVAAGVRPGAALWSKRTGEVEGFRALVLEADGLVFSTPSEVAELFEP